MVVGGGREAGKVEANIVAAGSRERVFGFGLFFFVWSGCQVRERVAAGKSQR